MIKGWEHLRFWESDAFKYICDNWNHICHPQRILPNPKVWFRALELTPYDKARCVILGQDPYPTRGHANGLAFSVYPHVRPLPRSLRNIFTEYQSDLGYPEPRSGDLSEWAERGVLLLNSILTVEEGRSLSHAGIGWERLTFEIVRLLGKRRNVVGLLWGAKAQEYTACFMGREMVVSSPHPSPMSAHTGFFGSRPFSRVNDLLKGMNVEPIDWRLR